QGQQDQAQAARGQAELVPDGGQPGGPGGEREPARDEDDGDRPARELRPRARDRGGLRRGRRATQGSRTTAVALPSTLAPAHVATRSTVTVRASSSLRVTRPVTSTAVPSSSSGTTTMPVNRTPYS